MAHHDKVEATGFEPVMNQLKADCFAVKLHIKPGSIGFEPMMAIYHLCFQNTCLKPLSQLPYIDKNRLKNQGVFRIKLKLTLARQPIFYDFFLCRYIIA